eukprot:1966948-Pyramimonas_sp.AAC.1
MQQHPVHHLLAEVFQHRCHLTPPAHTQPTKPSVSNSQSGTPPQPPSEKRVRKECARGSSKDSARNRRGLPCPSGVAGGHRVTLRRAAGVPRGAPAAQQRSVGVLVLLVGGLLEGILLNSWVGSTNVLAECKTCYKRSCDSCNTDDRV